MTKPSTIKPEFSKNNGRMIESYEKARHETEVWNNNQMILFIYEDIQIYGTHPMHEQNISKGIAEHKQRTRELGSNIEGNIFKGCD
jgi:hypothetical protein